MTDEEAHPTGPATPSSAATVLLIKDDPFEVLMVRRRRGGSFSSALVFPGGRIEDHDADSDWLPHLSGADSLSEAERALRIAAVRETFEESAILIGELGGRPLPTDRQSPFLDTVRRNGVMLPLDRLHPFSRWITPEREARRFDTHFYVAAAPAGQLGRHDDVETVALEWASPSDLIARADAGEGTILFPTLMNLRRLAETSDVATALAAADAREIVPVLPVLEPHPQGFQVSIDPRAGYGEGGQIIPELQTRR